MVNLKTNKVSVGADVDYKTYELIREAAFRNKVSIAKYLRNVLKQTMEDGTNGTNGKNRTNTTSQHERQQ